MTQFDSCYLKALRFIRETRFQLNDQGINNQAWLDGRANSVGASESHIFFGKNNIVTKNHLILNKAGIIKKEFTSNQYTIFGHVAENINVKIALDIKRREGFPLLEAYEMTSLTHPDYPFIGASLDRLLVDHEHKHAFLLEAKSPQKCLPSGKPKPEYLTQIQQQLFITGIENCIFSNIFFEFFDPNDYESGYNKALYFGILYQRNKIEGDDAHNATISYKPDDNIIYGVDHLLHKETTTYQEFLEYLSIAKEFTSSQKGMKLITWFVQEKYIEQFHIERDPEWGAKAIEVIGDAWNRIENLKKDPTNPEKYVYKNNPTDTFDITKYYPKTQLLIED